MQWAMVNGQWAMVNGQWDGVPKHHRNTRLPTSNTTRPSTNALPTPSSSHPAEVKTKKVVVVGGGVIGTACAYYLAKHGCEVTIVDKFKQGKGCSDGNCGLLAFSHILPLCEPGAVSAAAKMALSHNSPLYIKPRFDPALFAWLVKFALRCNHKAMVESGDALSAMMRSSASLFHDLFTQEPIECEWQQAGCLFVHRQAETFEAFTATDKLLRERYGEGAERYDATQLTTLEPTLKPGLAGGWLYRCDEHLRPETLMRQWRQVIEGMGVEILEGHELVGIDGDGRAEAIRTGGDASGDRRAYTLKDRIEADDFVIATGAMTPKLKNLLGMRVPVQPGKGYSVTMPRPRRCPHYPLCFHDHKIVVTPMKSGYRLGSTMEFSGYDHRLNTRRLDLLVEGARHYLVDPQCEPIEDRWFGWRPMTYDGRPIIGATPRRSNVWIATGHNMLGLTLATGTGQLVAELVTGARPHIDPTPYLPTRF